MDTPTYNRNYIIGIDFIRIISCLMILAFHSRGSLGLSYGFLNEYIDQGAVFCTIFFMISGFSLYLSNENRKFVDIGELKEFYKRRCISIMPTFVVAWIVYYFVFGGGKIPYKHLIRLALFEFLGLRCELLYLPGMNYFWFISCMMMGYMVFPFVQNVIKQLSIKSVFIFIIAAYSLLLYAKYLEEFFGTNAMTYYSPFFRILEMIIGVLCCRLMRTKFEKMNLTCKCKKIAGKCIILVSSVAFFGFYTLFLKSFGNRWMWYDMFIIPCIGLILINIDCVGCSSKSADIMKFIAGITYEIYLLQIWTFQFFGKGGVGHTFFTQFSNWIRVCIAWGCIFISSLVINKLIKLIMHKN